MKKIILASLITMTSIGAYSSEYEPNSYTRKIKPQEFGQQVFFTKTNTEEQMDIFFNNGKYYLAGKKGDSYTINVCGNRYSKHMYRDTNRTLFVVSVDGLNVISGEPAAYKQTGYVVPTNSCNKIKGWRKNMNEEALFFLTSLENSYSNKTNNDTSNVGVIGIAMFNEYQEPSKPIISYENEHKLNGMAGASKSAESGLASPSSKPMDEMVARKSETIGTGHGERVTSQATSTDFKRASEKPYKVISFYYDTYENLLEKGIIRKKYQGPQAFPTETKFAPDPMR